MLIKSTDGFTAVNITQSRIFCKMWCSKPSQHFGQKWLFFLVFMRQNPESHIPSNILKSVIVSQKYSAWSMILKFCWDIKLKPLHLCVYWTFYRCVCTGQTLILSSLSTWHSVHRKGLLPLCAGLKFQGYWAAALLPQRAVCKPARIKQEAKFVGTEWGY